MEVLTGTEIRDFRIRGNYTNRRMRLFQSRLPANGKDIAQKYPGYTPTVIDYELADGRTHSLTIDKSHLPGLIDGDLDRAKTCLCHILEQPDIGIAAAQEPGSFDTASRLTDAVELASETDFVVPCTSGQAHSEQTISHKASILLKLYQLGYSVPDFVVLTARAYMERDHSLDEHLSDALHRLEAISGQTLGRGDDPLVFALRCATGQYIPGVMDTYLNVGITEATLPALERVYGTVAARKMYLNNLRNLCRLLNRDKYASALNAVRHDLNPEEVDRAVKELSDILRYTGQNLIEDPFLQALFLAKQAYKDFQDNQELVVTLGRGTEHYPSLILQKMVCTVRHDEAYAGVIFSRHTQTGVGVELQTAHNIFGEELMTGSAETDTTAFSDPRAIRNLFPAVYHFVPHLEDLEQEFESPVTIEFAVEATPRQQWFALLQLNETAMAGRAAFTAVIDMHKAGTISRQRVVELIRPYHIKQLTSDTIDQEVFDKLTPFCGGVSVLPRSAISARLYFSGEAALKAKSMGQRVCLCKASFVPTDTVVMREMDAIISLTSAAIHVVTICQSLGIPALLSLENDGVRLRPDGCLVNAEGEGIKEGDWITLSSKRKTIYLGEASFVPGRLLRFIQRESIVLDDDEKRTFPSIAYAYRYYQQLTKDLQADQISTLAEVTRLVNFELRRDSEESRKLVNSWFDERESVYMEEVLKSDIGDHLGQSNVFEMLSLQRKIKFFKLALQKCSCDRISGYEAGAFMLGRFLCMSYPTNFWRAFEPAEIGLLVNEWVLFEKYMQLLHNVGERKLLMARKQILKGGLEELSLHPGNLRSLITLKLSGTPLEEAKQSLPSWSDPQCQRVLELLQQPYRFFYDFNAAWSLGQLQRICRDENVPLPRPDDT